MDPEPLATFGSQRQTPWSVSLGMVTAVLTAVPLWYQFGPFAGGPILLLGVLSTLAHLRNRHLPCYTVEAGQLIHHLGRHRRRYPWSDLRRPVRRRRHALEEWIALKRGQRPLLLPLSGLAEDERERLFQVIRDAVHAVSRHAAGASEAGSTVAPVDIGETAST